MQEFVIRQNAKVNEVGITPASAGDVESIARINVDAWRAGFVAFLPSEFLNSLTADSVIESWAQAIWDETKPIFAAARAGNVVGFLQVLATPQEGHGDIRALYVHPSEWGRGVGSSLLAFGESWLAYSGPRTASLWTAQESTQSRQFYEHRGWQATGETITQYLRDSVPLREVQYQKPIGV